MAETASPCAEQEPDHLGDCLSTQMSTEPQLTIVGSMCPDRFRPDDSLFLTIDRPEGYNFTKSGLGNEDCLFLSISARPNAKNLPVMVWIRECLVFVATPLSRLAAMVLRIL